jgi:hypothetical protein
MRNILIAAISAASCLTGEKKQERVAMNGGVIEDAQQSLEKLS